jgi:hydrogenase nickel incorporation protein HypA/HybF
MHELSLAQNIVEIVEHHVLLEQRRSVKSIRIKVGELSGVVPDSLEFCFSAITAETSLSGASLEIERVPFMLLCERCNKTFVGDFGVVLCPDCDSNETIVLSGTEMQIVDIELCETVSG